MDRSRTARLTARVVLSLLSVALSAALPAETAPAAETPAGTWSVAALPPGPDGRFDQQTVYAPELHLLIMFGGVTERGFDNDVYWMDPAHPEAGWQTFDPAGGPGPRAFAASTWDPVGHRLLVFGGVRARSDSETLSNYLGLGFGNNFMNDVWALTFDPSGATPPRWSALFADTKDTGSLLAPSERIAASAIFDPPGNRLIVYGGNDSLAGILGAYAGDFAKDWAGLDTGVSQGRNDVWAFDLATRTWSRLSGPLGGGPALYAHQAIYDPIGRQMVVAGGASGYDSTTYHSRFNTHTYSFDLVTNTWTTWAPQGTPPAVVGGAYGYSPERHALIVMPGEVDEASVDRSGVFALTLGPAGAGARWEQLPSSGPVHRPLDGLGGTVVGDPERLVVFGGLAGWGSDSGYVADSELSSYDLATGRWSVLRPSVETMRANAGASAAMDPEHGRLYVVGGLKANAALLRPLGDTTVWALDVATGRWERVRAGGEIPSGAMAMTAAYDTARDRLLVYDDHGGDVWSLDTSGAHPVWQRLDTAGDVPGLSGANIVYDPVRDRLLVLGGEFTSPLWNGYFGPAQQPDMNESVFALDLALATPAWHRMATAGTAPLLERQRYAWDPGVTGTAVYDPFADRILTFGAVTLDQWGNRTMTNDVYSLDLSSGPGGSWMKLSASGNAPSARQGAAVVFDPSNDRLIVWGGSPAGSVGVETDVSTYVLDLAGGSPTWSKLATQGDPRNHVSAAAAYDPLGQRMLVVGGFTDDQDESLIGSRDALSLSLGGSLQPPSRTVSAEEVLPPTPGPVQGGRWRTLGPPAAHTLSVLVSSRFAEDHTVFAGSANVNKTDPDAVGLFVSHDAGAGWASAEGDIRGAAVLRIVQSPSDPSRLYASARGGGSHDPVYVSSDGGTTWRSASRGLPNGAYYALAVDPTDPDVAWAGGDQGGVFRTTDGGATWAEADDGISGLWTYGLGVVPLGGGSTVRLLAATRDLGSAVNGSGAVFASDDLGVTWSPTLIDKDYVTYGFAVDPSNPAHVLLAAGDGVWSSSDAGLDWEQIDNKDINPMQLAFDPASGGQVVYASSVTYAVNFNGLAGGQLSPAQVPGLFRSTDGGASWEQIDAVPIDEDFAGVSVASDGSVFAASLNSGLYRTLDGGTTWTHAVDGMRQSATMAIAVDAADPSRLAAASNFEGVRTSTDGGASWQTHPLAGDSQSAFFVAASPLRSGRLLAVNYNGIQVSNDWGQTWQQRTITDGNGNPEYPAAAYKQPGTLAFDPRDANTWYVSLQGGAVAVTHDDGQSFATHTITNSSGGGYGLCPIPIAVDPQRPSHLLVGDTCGTGVWASSDGGTTWTRQSDGLADGNVTAIAFDPVDPSRVWVGTLHEGVFRSTDGGTTWTAATSGLGYRYVKYLVAAPSTQGTRLLGAVFGRGVYESDDLGATWSPVLDGTISRAPIHLTVGTSGALYVASDGGGVAVLEP